MLEVIAQMGVMIGAGIVLRLLRPGGRDPELLRRGLTDIVYYLLLPALVGEPSPHEAHLLRLDCSKARALLGWVPRLGAGDAIAWTVDWYRAHARGDDVRALTLAQVERYQGLQA